MNQEVIEALRSAQELCAFLWHSVDPDEPTEGEIELIAHTDNAAQALSALLNDTMDRVSAAIDGIEIQSAHVGETSSNPHGPVPEHLMRKFYGPPK